MRRITEKLNGLVILQNKKYIDKRGFFSENYNEKEFFKIIKKKIKFIQDNISFSKKSVIRGLHYQTKPFEQGKLVSVIKGKVFDVAVDIRPGSKYFGKYFSIELSDTNNRQFWIPPGFAHGYQALEDSIVKYKTTKFYSPNNEINISYIDKEININWPIKKKNISAKDLNGISILSLK